MGLSEPLSPLKWSTNVCIYSYTSFSIDAPISSSHSQISQHFKPQLQTQAPKCHRAGMGHGGWILIYEYPMVESRAGTQRWPPLWLSLFPLLCLCPVISALLFLDSPRNHGVNNCITSWRWLFNLRWVLHYSLLRAPLIHQHLLLLSPCSADISALNASWPCCLLDAVRDYLLRKADGYVV